MAKMPLFEARSDKIPGLMPSEERRDLIRKKGQMGAKAPEQEKALLIKQLMDEYTTSPDQNMRREAVDAMAMIKHPWRDRNMKEILKDENAFIRISALEALDNSFDGTKTELATIFIEHLRNDQDKDVRLRAATFLGDVRDKNEMNKNIARNILPGAIVPENEVSRQIELALGEALHDKVPAVRFEAMQSLKKVSGKDYGNDINRWLAYISYSKGETTEAPKEQTLAERLPTIHLPMLK